MLQMPDSVANDFETVLAFWFGPLDERGIADPAHSSAWFTKDAAFDERIRSEFLPLHQKVFQGARDAWLETPRSRLAFLIVLDQFSRNLFRDTPKMFEGDPIACAAAISGIDAGMHEELGLDPQWFFFMPLMHSEILAIQERCVKLFEGWSADQTGPLLSHGRNAVEYARRHRDIIRRFGRFPHRNQLLSRESTAEELEFLKGPGSSF